MNDSVKIIHEGNSIHRLHPLAENHMEKAFHDRWCEENSGGDNSMLKWLMGDGVRQGEVDQRDALVAATVAQWLGSPVGQRFLGKVQDRYEANLQLIAATELRDELFPQ